MEAFFGSNKKNLKVCRFGTNQGEPSISWSGFLSLPAEPVLWKLHSQDCAEVTNADLWQQQGTGKLCVEMTACVIAEDDGCVPGRGWGQVWVPQGTAAPAQPPHPPSTHPALSPAPPEPAKLPSTAALPDFSPFSRVSSRSQCICWN